MFSFIRYFTFPETKHLAVLTFFVFAFHRKSQDSQKELKLLLDMYKSVPKESRDRVQVRTIA